MKRGLFGAKRSPRRSAAVTAFDYDRLDQLTFVDYPTGSDPTYDYDANGTRADGSWDAAAYNRLATDGKFDFEYDDEGNLTSIEDPTPSGGDERTTFTWDHRNRLSSVTIETYDAGQSDYEHTRTVTFEYDPFDRRIEKRTLEGTEQSPTVDNVSYYAYDGSDIVLRFDRDENLRSRYLHGPAVDQILADEQYGASDDPSEDPGEVYWPATDHLGSVRQLIDSAGDEAKRQTFDAWGELTADSAPSVKHIYGCSCPFSETGAV